MFMKTIGTLSTFIEPMEANIVVGRQIAAAAFLQALLSYSNFERIDFFLPNPYSCKFARSYFQNEFGSENMGGRVRIFEHTQLPELLRSERYDVFHLADFTTYLPALAHLRQNLAREPFPITGLSASISEKSYLEHYFRMMLNGVQDFDGIICISHCVKEALEKAFRMIEQRFEHFTASAWRNPIDLSIIPLAVDANLFGQWDRKTAREKLDLPPDRKIILIFGRYSYVDKMDFLPVVDIAVRLGTIFEKDPPLFLLAGSDPLNYGSLFIEYAKRKGADGYFCMRSNIAPDDKPQYYAAADVFFSPADNLQESFGITILEAMASSLPVVASDFNGYRELIEDGKTGFRIPTYWGDAAPDIESLSGILYRNSHNFYLAQSIALDLEKAIEALEILLAHPELRIEMGQAGRKRVEANYNWKTVIGMHEDLWTRLADKMRGRVAAPAPDPFEASYYQLFNHYPTRALAGEDQILITGEGMRVMEEKTSPPIYPELVAMISGEVLHHILVLCRRQSRSVAFLQDKLQSIRQTPPQASLYHILWALKQGLVKLTTDKY
jgi:glycosyltransferase involved in cell wall biosynthesis